jgi:pectate lyase
MRARAPVQFRSAWPAIAMMAATLAISAADAAAGPVGYGAATTGGGSAPEIAVGSMQAMQSAIDSYDGSSGVVLRYTGIFDFGSIGDVCGQWTRDAQIVQIKRKNNITVIGASGSSANFGIHIAGPSSNIIVRNMTIGLLPGGEDADAISIEGMSSGAPSDIWIDHNSIFASLMECPGAGDASFDGGIDMKKGAHHITVSYNYIHDYQKVALNGFSDSDTGNSSARTTYHHNRYENVKSRLPLQRFGRTHIYSNYFKNVSTSGINVRMGGLSLIESNVFETVKNPVTSRDSSSIGFWDLRDNLATGITWDDGDEGTVNATDWATTMPFGPTGYSYTVTPVADVKARVLATAGAGTNLAE